MGCHSQCSSMFSCCLSKIFSWMSVDELWCLFIDEGNNLICVSHLDKVATIYNIVFHKSTKLSRHDALSFPLKNDMHCVHTSIGGHCPRFVYVFILHFSLISVNFLDYIGYFLLFPLDFLLLSLFFFSWKERGRSDFGEPIKVLLI